jgi:hypothetical protein
VKEKMYRPMLLVARCLYNRHQIYINVESLKIQITLHTCFVPPSYYLQ